MKSPVILTRRCLRGASSSNCRADTSIDGDVFGRVAFFLSTMSSINARGSDLGDVMRRNDVSIYVSQSTLR
jgi:hypothetical protein